MSNDTLNEISGDTDIKRSIRLATQDVNIKGLVVEFHVATYKVISVNLT